jgi:hypothetical protein
MKKQLGGINSGMQVTLLKSMKSDLLVVLMFLCYNCSGLVFKVSDCDAFELMFMGLVGKLKEAYWQS